LKLVEKGLVESDATGHYRLKPRPKKQKQTQTHWVSPEIRKILEKSSKDFSSIFEIKDEDEDFNKE
jgi:hypothetical protein